MVGAANKKRGETPLASIAVPEVKDATGKVVQAAVPVGHSWSAGDGVVLRYRNSDLAIIESVEGPAFFNKLIDSVMAGTVTFSMLDLYLKQGVKKDGKPFELDEDDLDDIPVHELWETIADALCRSMRGLSARDYMEEIMKRLMEGSSDPLLGLGSPTSTTSEPDASDPAG